MTKALLARAERFTHAIHGARRAACNDVAVAVIRQQRNVIERINLFVQVPAIVVLIARPIVHCIGHPGALSIQRVIAKRRRVIQRIFRAGEIAAVVIGVRRHIPARIRDGERLATIVVGVSDGVIEWVFLCQLVVGAVVGRRPNLAQAVRHRQLIVAGIVAVQRDAAFGIGGFGDIAARIVFVDGDVAQAIRDRLLVIIKVVVIGNGLIEGVFGVDQTPIRVIPIVHHRLSARINNRLQVVLGIIGELRCSIFQICDAHQIACRVVGVGDRLVVRIGDLRNPPVGIAREHDAQACRMRDAVRREVQHIAIRIGDRLHAARLVYHVDKLLRCRELKARRIEQRARRDIKQVYAAQQAIRARHKEIRLIERFQHCAIALEISFNYLFCLSLRRVDRVIAQAGFQMHHAFT